MSAGPRPPTATARPPVAGPARARAASPVPPAAAAARAPPRARGRAATRAPAPPPRAAAPSAPAARCRALVDALARACPTRRWLDRLLRGQRVDRAHRHRAHGHRRSCRSRC